MPRILIIKRRRPFARLLTALLALLILNTSIDTPDPSDTIVWNGEDYVEDLSYNDIESFYELVTEEFLDLEDFVPEHDDDSGDTDKTGKTLSYWLATEPQIFSLTPPKKGKPVYYAKDQQYFSISLDVNSPPPDKMC